MNRNGVLVWLHSRTIVTYIEMIGGSIKYSFTINVPQLLPVQYTYSVFSPGFFEGVVGAGQALGQGGGRNVRDY